MMGTQILSILRQVSPAFLLFRFASPLDVILLLIGVLSASIHGVALPLAMHFFGLLTNAFVNQFSSKQLANFEFRFDPVDFLELPRFAIVDPKLIVSGFINFTNLTGGVVNCSEDYVLLPPILNFDETLELGVTELAECLEDDDFIAMVNTYVYSFIGIAVGVVFFATVQIFTFQVSAERQVRKIKEKFFSAVLGQEEKWFDSKASGEISSRLSNDISKIQEGIGDQLSISIQWITTFVVGFLIAFNREWRLALLLLAITPLVIITVTISSMVVLVLTSKEQRQQASASAIVEEAINAIKTVVAFGGEVEEVQRYEQKLRIADVTAMHRGVVVSLSLGLIYLLIFICYSVAFWFSAWLLSREIIQAGDVLTVFFAVLIGIFSLGQAVPNFQKFSSAVGASVAVYDIISQKPKDSPEDDQEMKVLGHSEPNVGEPNPKSSGSYVESNAGEMRAAGMSNAGMNIRTSSTGMVANKPGAGMSAAGMSNAGMSAAEMSAAGMSGSAVSAAGVSNSAITAIAMDTPRMKTSGTSTAPAAGGFIEFKNVSFSYPSRPDIQILKNFNLSVKEGQTVALVGSSGSGKSTVIQLLLKFYNLYEGQILYGGKDIRTMDTKTFRKKLGFVGQEPVLFDTSIEKNIKLGNLGASDIAMEKAAAAANAHDFITTDLPDGYETNVGKQGAQLSGGQKQRIALARALIRQPQVLLLDDTTSALDAESEHIVQEALDSAKVGRTTIIVSHRLSTIAAADTVAFMSDGKVTEIGSHNQLMAMDGSYTSLVETKYSSTSSSDEGNMQRKSSTAAGGVQLEDLESESDIEEDFPAIPTKTEKQEEKSPFSWRRIWRMNGPEIWLIVVALIAVVVQGAVYPAFALFFGQVLRVFTLPFNQVLGEIHVWAAMFLILGLLSGCATFVKNICFFLSEHRLTFRLRSLTFQSILRQEMAWFELKENSPSTLTSRLAIDAAQIPGATGVQFGTVVETAISMFVAVVISLAVNQLLSVVIIGFLPFLILPGLLQLAVLSTYTSRYKRHNEQAEKIALDAINNHLTVHALSVEDEFTVMYHKKLDDTYRYSAMAAIGYGMTYAFSQAVVFLGYAITFRFGAFQSVQPINGNLYVRFEFIYTVFMALIFGSLALGQANGFAPNYSKAKQAAKRVFSLLDRKSEIDGTSNDGTVPVDFKGKISLKRTWFSYPSRPGVDVIAGLKYTAAPNKASALAGPSGCGKSTIIALILRFYDPTSGSVMVDGMDIRLLSLKWLRSNMSIVFQEPVLFDRTIEENIRYGISATSLEVTQAAIDANIHDFIQSLPNGYKTVAGQMGTQLSRGQKQRIAIARALIRHPKVLLLDEATSALDAESEREVQRVLDDAVKNRTSIVIAHRLSTIRDSDKITVMRKGKIIEEGRHEDLMQKDGLYNRMYTYQTSVQ